MPNDKKFALLIDADNISDKYIKVILDELSNEGVVTYKRIYGDWTSTKNKSWKPVLLDNSIVPIQQYSYTTGKNATDSAMIIDAMDILYSEQVDGFCLASSDSDFTRLAARLRESGMLVIGMGESKTPKPFIAACNQFKYLDILFLNSVPVKEAPAPREEPPAKAAPAKPAAARNRRKPTGGESRPAPQTDIETIRTAVLSIADESSDDEEGWLFSGALGNLLAKRYPDFDARNYGFSKLTPFLQSIEGLEIKSVDNGHNQLIYVRRKPEQK